MPNETVNPIENYRKSPIQMLISAVDENVTTLAFQMGLECDAIIINQCHENAYSEYYYRGHLMRCFHSTERGVGLSRNTALMHADAEYVMFADEDIVYREGYAEAVWQTFNRLPTADMILFNVKQAEGRQTYRNDSYKRVRWFNYGRYPAYAIAARTKRLRDSGVTFSLLFGGGAKYSAGEDSLFLHDCLKAGLRLHAAPVLIGEETGRPSTWFEGYTEKYFRDRGVLYHHLFGDGAKAMSLRFLLAHRGELCKDHPIGECYAWMKDGIRIGKETA